MGPVLLYKLGQTQNKDATERLSEEYAKKYNFRAIPLGRDYYVTTIWSAWFSKEQANQIEASFKQRVPKNFYCNEVYNGISECRILTDKQVGTICERLQTLFPKPEYGYKEGSIKVYFAKLRRKQSAIFDEKL